MSFPPDSIAHQVVKPGRGVVSPGFCGLLHMKPVQVIGRPVRMEVERSALKENIDHFWITIQVPEVGKVLLAVNTSSLRNRRAGFDDRLRVGRVTKEFHRGPEAGLSRSRLLNYASIEENANVFYESLEREELEEVLAEEASRATWVQAWGVAFCRTILGVHQIHSRRASCAVPEDLKQMDGALRFYRKDEGTARMWLLKFCGQ